MGLHVGAYVIIDNSDKIFVQIIAKYRINLENSSSESRNIKNLKNTYKEFFNYKGIDLLNKK